MENILEYCYFFIWNIFCISFSFKKYVTYMYLTEYDLLRGVASAWRSLTFIGRLVSFELEFTKFIHLCCHTC